MSWVNVGPSNVGGCMFGIAVDPSGQTDLLAVAASGGCWRLHYDRYAFPAFSASGSDWFPTLEVGTEYRVVPHWTPLTDSLPLLYMTALAICERHPETIYCVTGHYNRVWPTQVWRSDDRGSTWSNRSTPGLSLAYRLAIDPDDADRVYAATVNGLMGSTDGGTTWSVLYAGVAYDVAVDPDDADIVYAGIEDVGVVKTSNARPSSASRFGRFGFLPVWPLWRTVLAWKSATPPAGKTIRIGLGAGSATQRTVVAKLDQEVFVNHDAGRGAWASKGRRGGAGQGDWDHVVAADPHNRSVLLAGAQNLFRSADGGDTWTQVAGYGSSAHSDQQHVIFDRRQPGVTYLANDGGIWVSFDSGSHWLDLNDGLVTAELFHAGISGGSAMADMYHEGLVATTRLQTSRWAVVEGGSWEFSDVYGDPVRPGRFFVFGGKLGLRRLFRVAIFDLGSGWPPSVSMRIGEVELGDFNVAVGDFPPRSIEFDRRAGSNTIVVGTADGRVMRAVNGDSATPTWQAESGIAAGGSPVVGLTFAPGAPVRYYAICDSGAVFAKGDIGSATAWASQGAANPGVIDFAIDAGDENRLYALHDGGLETSADGGATWQWINGVGLARLPSRGLKSVFAHPRVPSFTIVGAVGGIFASTNQGATWSRYDSGLPNAEIKQVFMADGDLYAATVGRGLWKHVRWHFGMTGPRILLEVAKGNWIR